MKPIKRILRPLKPRYKVQCDSLPEMQLGLREEAMRLANPPHDLYHGDRPLSYGPLFVRVLCYFMSLPPDLRDRIVAAGGTILDRHMAADPAALGESRRMDFDEADRSAAMAIWGSRVPGGKDGPAGSVPAEPAKHPEGAGGRRMPDRDRKPKRVNKAV